MSFTKKTIPALTIAIATLAFQSGCSGGYSPSDRDDVPKRRTQSGVPLSPGEVVVESGSESGDSASTDAGGAEPIYSFKVRGTGYVSKTFKVMANRVLMVRFSPGQQDRTVPETGFTPVYAQLGVFIKVGTDERPTPLLSNGLIRTPTSTLPMDFSGTFDNKCGDDPDCRMTVSIKVYKPNYDYWCLNYGAYCSHTHVDPAHPWNGTLEIQTDDTVALEESDE